MLLELSVGHVSVLVDTFLVGDSFFGVVLDDGVQVDSEDFLSLGFGKVGVWRGSSKITFELLPDGIEVVLKDFLISREVIFKVIVDVGTCG